MRQKQSMSYHALDITDQIQDGYPKAEPQTLNTHHSLNQRLTRATHALQGFLIRTWLPEILCWLVSALLTIGLIALLHHYQNQAVPKWPYRITLNAVIALLSTLAKASLLLPVAQALSQLKWLWFTSEHKLSDIGAFDDASRGTLGSLKLLRLLFKNPLATLGALVMVLALAIDPFAQQIVTYPLRQIPTGVATIDYAKAYSTYYHQGTGSSFTPSLSMKASIISGLYGMNQAILPSCPGGNCTWNTPYTTLAICSKCTDLTDQLQINTKPLAASYRGADCQATLPSGASLRTAGNFFINVTWPSTAGSRNPLSRVAYFAVITAEQSARDCNNINATECTLDFCSQTYSANNVEGHWQEKLLSLWINETTLGTDESPISKTLTLEPPSDQEEAEQDRPFEVPYLAMHAISSFMTEQINGTAYANNPTWLYYDNDVVQAIFQSANLTEMMANVASSMTANIRQRKQRADNINYAYFNDQNTVQSAVGTAWGTESFVHVRWAWISLLIVLEMLSLVFLAVTIMLSAWSAIPAWKSSALSVLRCKLTPAAAQQMDLAKQLGDMERVSEHIDVVLHQTTLVQR